LVNADYSIPYMPVAYVVELDNGLRFGFRSYPNIVVICLFQDGVLQKDARHEKVEN
jgi:hypothetical protein